ncbi:unnamed protein product, partial [Rotaria sp. Silwood1]
MIDFRKRVFSMLGSNKGLKKVDIVKHFAQEGSTRSTVYNITKRYEIGLPVEHRPGARRPTYFDRKNLK